MSSFCPDCGRYLGGYGHAFDTCDQHLVPYRMAGEMKVDHKLDFSVGIIRTAIMEATSLLELQTHSRLSWKRDADRIKAQALVGLGIVKQTYLHDEAGL